VDWCKGEGAGLDGGGLSVWESGGGEREGGIGGLDGGGAVPEPWGEAEPVGVCGAGDPVGGGGILAGGTKVAWLPGELAPDAAVRYNVPGRRIVPLLVMGW